jgi:hypothetical protein
MTVDGGGVLYHYLQKALLQDDIWLFQMVTARLITSLGIWLPVEVYRRFPLLVPFAVRDPDARGRPKQGIPDRWGEPNEDGYFRDDNSLVKGLPKSLSIRSSASFYQGRRLGNGFIAAHVWQLHADDSRSTRHPLTYSFVPNLVWLPRQVALLTDRSGSFVPAFLQALAHKIYRTQAVEAQHEGIVEKAWRLLPSTPDIPSQGLPDPATLNYFEPTDRFFSSRRRAIKDALSLLATTLGDGGEAPKVSTRYNAGIGDVDPDKLRDLHGFLERYLSGPSSEGIS